MNTPEGLRKAVETNLKRDPNYYRKIGAKGGAKSSNRPMKDPAYASKMGKLAQEKRLGQSTPCPECGLPFIVLGPHMRKHDREKAVAEAPADV